MDDSKKQEGRHKARAVMDDFCKTLEDMALEDVKPDNGWFTRTKNNKGGGMFKERLDRFVVSLGWSRLCPLLSSKVLQ